MLTEILQRRGLCRVVSPKSLGRFLQVLPKWVPNEFNMLCTDVSSPGVGNACCVDAGTCCDRDGRSEARARGRVLSMTGPRTLSNEVESRVLIAVCSRCKYLLKADEQDLYGQHWSTSCSKSCTHGQLAAKLQAAH